MNTQHIEEIIRELKTELYNAKRKAQALGVADEARLYYNGVIVGLQVSIGRYEKWLYGMKKPPKAAAPKRTAKNRAKPSESRQAAQCGGNYSNAQ